MAKFYSAVQFDIRQFTFQPLFSGWAVNDISFFSQPTTLHGVAYLDSAKIVASNTATPLSTDQFELLMASTGSIAMREFPENPWAESVTTPITGTVHGISLKFSSGLSGEAQGVEVLGMTGVSIDPLALLAAAQTVSQTDDRALIMGQLAGNDTFVLSNAADYMTAGSGNDTMTGNNGADTLFGDAGIDRLFGGSGVDVIYGGNESDFIQGGISADRLYGGASGDQFIFNDGETARGASGRDVIFDFRRGIDDLDLRLVDARTSTAADNVFAYSGTTAKSFSVWYNVVGTNVIVFGDNTGDARADFEIELRGVSSLTSGDFLL